MWVVWLFYHYNGYDCTVCILFRWLLLLLFFVIEMRVGFVIIHLSCTYVGLQLKGDMQKFIPKCMYKSIKMICFY